MLIIERIVGGIGRALARLVPFRGGSGLFFFFPFYHLGGAERVHADIVGCFAAERPRVFFAKRSRDRALRVDFEAAARVFPHWFLLKYLYPFSAGFLAGLINRHPKGVAFGCNSLFFYRMLPFLAPHVRKIDLIHAFGGGAEGFSLPVVHLLDRRVVITGKTREDLAGQYRENGIDEGLMERVVLIENRVEAPGTVPAREWGGALRILYVGRGAPEKRLHLVGRIAAGCRERRLPVAFTMVGDMSGISPPADFAGLDLKGEITDRGGLGEIYDRSHLLILTSEREGFPVVIMEAMARGVVPISTDVGGISRHLVNGGTGWLVDNLPDEDRIVETFLTVIERICHNRDELARMSAAAHRYAREHFTGEGFCASYRGLMLGPLG